MLGRMGLIREVPESKEVKGHSVVVSFCGVLHVVFWAVDEQHDVLGVLTGLDMICPHGLAHIAVSMPRTTTAVTEFLDFSDLGYP